MATSGTEEKKKRRQEKTRELERPATPRHRDSTVVRRRLVEEGRSNHRKGKTGETRESARPARKNEPAQRRKQHNGTEQRRNTQKSLRHSAALQQERTELIAEETLKNQESAAPAQETAAVQAGFLETPPVLTEVVQGGEETQTAAETGEKALQESEQTSEPKTAGNKTADEFDQLLSEVLGTKRRSSHKKEKSREIPPPDSSTKVQSEPEDTVAQAEEQSEQHQAVIETALEIEPMQLTEQGEKMPQSPAGENAAEPMRDEDAAAPQSMAEQTTETAPETPQDEPETIETELMPDGTKAQDSASVVEAEQPQTEEAQPEADKPGTEAPAQKHGQTGRKRRTRRKKTASESKNQTKARKDTKTEKQVPQVQFPEIPEELFEKPDKAGAESAQLELAEVFTTQAAQPDAETGEPEPKQDAVQSAPGEEKETVDSLLAQIEAISQETEQQQTRPADGHRRVGRMVRLVVEKERKPVAKRVLTGLLLLMLVAALGFGGYVFWLSKQPPVIEDVSVGEELNEDNQVRMTVTVSSPYLFDTECWCALGETDTAPSPEDPVWQKAQGGQCSFDVAAGNYSVFVLDSRGNLCAPGNQTVEINQCVSVVLDKEKLYLPLGGSDQLSAELFILGDVPETVSWSSEDESVATVDESGRVQAVSEGETMITASSADGKTAQAYVMVTDLFKLPNIDTYSKPMLVGNPYTDEEAHLLDEILATKVEQAGYGTRAGAVAAARFLALEFEYRIPYFFENGRLSPHEGRPKCDGEGRFYHQGLYLCECKFEELDPIRFGPATWGQPLMNWETKYAFVGGVKYPNGLDCSGFVCWCLINGGTDVGDMGAGDEYGDNDLCDLAEKKWITTELLQSDEIQVGDLIAEDGHMAIIVGLTEDRIYIAESLFTSVRITNYPRDMSVVRSGLYTYIIPMGDIYQGDGNLTQYWE